MRSGLLLGARYLAVCHNEVRCDDVTRWKPSGRREGEEGGLKHHVKGSNLDV